MRIKLDENLLTSLAASLAALGHDVHHVEHEGLLGQSDAVVAAAARSENRILFALDVEFADLGKHSPGSHPGIVLFRHVTPGAPAICRHVESFAAAIAESEIAVAVTVVEFGRVRIRRPESAD